MQISEIGRQEFLEAISQRLTNIHLLTDNGEFQGQGYEPKRLDVTWVNGKYPEIKWRFTGGEPQKIIGWFITNGNNDVLLQSLFKDKTVPSVQGVQDVQNVEILNSSETFIIENDGDTFSVDPNIDLFTAV